jgi:hypothetical protein
MNDKKSKVKPFQSTLSKSLPSLSAVSASSQISPSQSQSQSVCNKKRCTAAFPIPKEIMCYKTVITLLAFYVGFKHNKGFNYDQIVLAAMFPEVYLVYVFAMNKKVFLG